MIVEHSTGDGVINIGTVAQCGTNYLPLSQLLPVKPLRQLHPRGLHLPPFLQLYLQPEPPWPEMERAGT